MRAERRVDSARVVDLSPPMLNASAMLRRGIGWWFVGVVGLGCTPGEATVVPEQPTAAAPSSSEVVPAPSATPIPDAGAAEEKSESVDASPPDPFANTSFPPPDFAPPHERSTKKGDGVWVRLGDEKLGERAAGEPAVLYRTTVMPHEVSKYVTVTVAAMDLKHTSLQLVAGTDDPGASEIAEGYTPGLIPASDQKDLVAVFNGGFKPQHGGWGMMIGGKQLVPPRDEGCTVVLNHDGTVRIGSWTALGEQAKQARAYRQTPPCLLEDGQVHANLKAGNARAWAGRNAHRKTRRRSAIGIDASGRVLFFGVGVEAEPELLAAAMKHAGAVNAAQLDINWNWTRFLLFGEQEGELGVTSTLIPQMVHRKRGYVHHTQPRDFFYLKRVSSD